MPREDLIPTLKTVKRSGRTKEHQQIYWMRAAELREALKEQGFEGAVQAAGGPAIDIEVMLKSWIESPGSAGAGELRGAASKLAFGNDKKAIDEELDDYRVASEMHYKADFAKEGVPIDETDKADFIKENEKSFRTGFQNEDAVRDLIAAAAVAQAAYTEDFVTVYRGVKGQQANEIKAYSDRLPEFDVDVGVTTSFSEDINQAAAFAGTGGVVIAQQIPRSSILATWKNFYYGGPVREDEQEVLVLTKGSMKIKATDVWRPNQYEEAKKTMSERALARQKQATP